MKALILRVIPVIFAIVTCIGANAQTTYDIFIANRALTSSTTMEFDVFIRSNGSTTTWPMRTYQSGYQFSAAFVNGGTLSGQYVAGSSGLTETSFGKTFGFTWNATNRVLNQSANTGSSCPGATIGTTARKICRVRVTNTANWGCADDDITIKTSGSGFLLLAVTRYATSDCSDATVQTITSGSTPSTSTPNESLLAATVTGSLSVTCGGTTDLTVGGSGGVAPYASGTGTFTVGDGSYNYTVTDARGCAATTSATVTTAPDVTAPTITACASNQSVTANSSTVPDFTSGVSATDNCTASGSLVITQSPAVGTSVSVGVTQVTITVTDAASNSSTCTANYTVIEPCNVSANASTTAVTCFGGSDGSATITLSGAGTESSGTYTVNGGTSQSYSTNPFTVSGLSAGSYSVSITSGICPSTATFTITAPSTPIVTTITDAACGSYTLPWGTVVTETDVYTNTYTSAAGCDSTVVASITITPFNYINSSASACDSYTWSANGWTYSQSGSYTSAGAGCDVNVLALTITASTSNTTTASSCSDYTWSVNGQTYTQSGTYSSVSGCATEILVLTISSVGTETAGTLSGNNQLCSGQTSQFTTDGTAGGTWSSDNTAVATVDASTGIVTAGSTSGTATITYSLNDACGNPLSATRQVSVTAFIVSALSGPTDACPYLGALYSSQVAASNAVYTVTATSASGFTWTVPAGATIISGQGTNSIAVHYASTYVSGTISVVVGNGCNPAAPVTRTITVTKGVKPATPTTILNTNICNFLGNGIPVTLRVSPRAANVTGYRWTLIPSFVTVLSAAPDSSSITVLIGSGFTAAASTARKVAVLAINGCGISAARSVTLTSTVPVAAAVIRGPLNVCLIQNTDRDTTYSIAAINGASTYNWVVPAGITITGRPFAGTINDTIINVRFDAGYGTTIPTANISVNGINNCGNGAIKSLKPVRTKPSTPAAMSRTTISSACPTQKYIYKISKMATNAYRLNWTVPAGAVIDSITNKSLWCYVTYPATGSSYVGNVTAVGVNSCSTSAPRILAQTITACAPAFADNNTGNQPIVRVNPNADLAIDFDVQAYPNPSTSSFKIRALTNGKEQINVRVLDVQGREYKRFIMMPGETLTLGSDLRTGTYLIEALQGKKMKTVRVIKL